MIDVFEKHLANHKFKEGAEKADTLEKKIAFCSSFLEKHDKNPFLHTAKEAPNGLAPPMTFVSPPHITYNQSTVETLFASYLVTDSHFPFGAAQDNRNLAISDLLDQIFYYIKMKPAKYLDIHSCQDMTVDALRFSARMRVVINEKV
jgi:hypothetical protein